MHRTNITTTGDLQIVYAGFINNPFTGAFRLENFAKTTQAKSKTFAPLLHNRYVQVSEYLATCAWQRLPLASARYSSHEATNRICMYTNAKQERVSTKFIHGNPVSPGRNLMAGVYGSSEQR